MMRSTGFIGSADVNWDTLTTAAEKLSMIANENGSILAFFKLPIDG